MNMEYNLGGGKNGGREGRREQDKEEERKTTKSLSVNFFFLSRVLEDKLSYKDLAN